MDATARSRLRTAAVGFAVVFLLFAVDVAIQFDGRFAPGIASGLAGAAAFHAIAFDAVLHRSRLGIAALWIAALAFSITAFALFSEPLAALALSGLLLAYTPLLLWCLRRMCLGQSSAV